MTKRILNAKNELDSVGGITETAICGIPAGVGEPWFDSVESLISHAIFSIGGIKGIEFGVGFAFADMKGSEANDSFRIEDGRVVTDTNNKEFERENFDYVDVTSIPLSFTIYTNRTIDSSTDGLIKEFISDFVESSNGTGLFAISNLLRSLENTFDEIQYGKHSKAVPS